MITAASCSIELDHKLTKGEYLETGEEKELEDRMQFPAYAHIVPKSEPLASVTIDSEILGKILKAFAKAGKHGPATVRLELRGEKDPVVLKAKRNDCDILALVMPCNPN